VESGESCLPLLEITACKPTDIDMLSSPLFRRMLLIFSGFGVFSLLVLGLVSLSTDSGVSILRWRMMVTAFALLVLGLSLMAQVVRSWIVPVVELTHAARIMSSGQQPERLHAEIEDEVGALTNAFNEMSQNVESRRAESQKNQTRIARDNEQLGTVLEAMVEGVIAVDRDETILLANMAAIRLLDLKAFNVVGRRTWESIRLPQIHELIKKTLSEEPEQHRMEVDVPWTQSIVAVVASKLPGNPCPGAVLVLHDVTELRRLENLRRDFVSNVSHELKTPLSAISAYTETLLNGALEDGEFGRIFVTRIAEQSERLNTLILDLLELARLESGEHAIVLDEVEINAILKSSADAHQAVAQAKQLTLTTVSVEGQLFVRADAEGLRTIADNLIGNAVNYTRPGGAVTVRSRRDSGSIVFEVEDNGVGIPKEFQSRIFERFFRVDRARSREVGGTGLGLSIVKHLCQLFGGSIKVHSQLGQGSTFTVQLKAASHGFYSARGRD
jgi:two-component system phosphate regulon sensor histidine kinase PhoR